MNDKKTVIIKLKPYLREFFCALQKEKNVNSSLKSFLGSVLLPFLSDVPKDYKPSLNKERESNELEIELVQYHHKVGPEIRGNVYIPEKNFKPVERILLEYFNSIFFTFMDVYVSNKTIRNGRIGNPFVNDAIYLFCVKYEINYDNFDCLKKKYYRERKQREGFLKNKDTESIDYIPYCVQNNLQIAINT